MQNKKGITTIMLVALIFTCLSLMIILGISTWGFSIVDDAISEIDFDIGNTSFAETYNQTLKQGVESMTTTVPTIISIGTMLGLILCLMLVGYNVKKIGRLWILFDVFFIVIATIIASAISSGFVKFLNTTPELLEIYSTTLSTGSTFVINLPIIIPVIGILIMLVTHIVIKDKEEDELTRF